MSIANPRLREIVAQPFHSRGKLGSRQAKWRAELLCLVPKIDFPLQIQPNLHRFPQLQHQDGSGGTDYPMVSRQPKIWRSHRAQIDILLERGLIITDLARALTCLERIGYYRLSGYWFLFRELSGPCCLLTEDFKRPKTSKETRLPLDQFKHGAQFSNAVDLYLFDKKLRLVALDALERIEIALRTDLSHRLGQSDRVAYMKPDLFHHSFSVDLQEDGLTSHHKWLSKHATLISRSKEEFIVHNKRRYGLPIPIWVACEVWDFGTMSMLFSGMKEADQDAISSRYGLANGRIFATWLRSLNYLRNVCAHHSRLWNRNIIDQPRLPPRTEALSSQISKQTNTCAPDHIFCSASRSICCRRSIRAPVGGTVSWIYWQVSPSSGIWALLWTISVSMPTGATERGRKRKTPEQPPVQSTFS